jgi:polysaccharide pyruvyl transferase WcaK-like protein
MESLRLADILLVNGEGSMHHNLPNALALLALIDVAADLGKPVYLINATIQALDDRLMRRIFPKLAALHVRELESLEQVAPFARIAFCAADIAILAIAKLVDASRATAKNSRPRCLITAGVLAQPDSIRAIAAAATSAGLEPAYLSLGDGGESEVATKVCGEIGIEHMRAEAYSLEQVTAFLAQFDVAVSGRHHINLFLMGLGVPFVPLPSNTWKIEATLSYLGYPLAPCRQFDEVAGVLGSVWRERGDVAKAGKLAFAKGLATLDGYASRVGL